MRTLRRALLPCARCDRRPIAPGSTPSTDAALARLRVAGATWTAEELRHGGTFLRSSRRTREALRDPRRP
ncbi:MAG: hypothetical protein MUD17_13240, partial [Gemmatimonadaceae bacterium]|nr:hypothetical protein [Gemmatimonadaceae bacterium]